eukprot:gene18144-23798_t
MKTLRKRSSNELKYGHNIDFEVKGKKSRVWDNLPWETVDIPFDSLVDDSGSVFMGLEVIDGSNIPDININKKKKSKENIVNDLEKVEIKEKEVKENKKKKKNKEKKIEFVNINDAIKLPNTVSNWGDDISLHSVLVEALNHLGFHSPTPIQKKAIPITIQSFVNIVGIAETGSGKTLAFILPILNTIILNWENSYNPKLCQTPVALIIAPTRELVLQITSVTNEIINYLASKYNSIRSIQIVPIVGGLSDHKQKRLLMNLSKRPVQIIVATPGRLNELIEDDDIIIFKDLSRLRYLVVDEVDRIMEDGHFPELNKIFNRIREHEKLTSQGICPIEHLRLQRLGTQVDDNNENDIIDEENNDDAMVNEYDDVMNSINNDKQINEYTNEIESVNNNDEKERLESTVSLIKGPYNPKERQTLLFSATASQKQLSSNNKKEKRVRGIGAGAVRSLPSHIQQLLSLVSACSSTEVIDVSVDISNDSLKDEDVQTSIKLPDTLTQLEYRVTAEDKDLYIYQCLLNIKGRVLVFVNSIKSARRLDGLLRALELNSRTIHAQLQQKQRMKAIEAFRLAPIGVLVATDVAARGLDIPHVDTVIHYDIARSPQLYTHRSGRTARAGATGTTISFVNPEDLQAHMLICQALKVKALPIWKCNPELSKILYERVRLAKKIFTQTFVSNQEQKLSQWVKQSSLETDIDIDDDLMNELVDLKANKKSVSSKGLTKKELSQLRYELKTLLNTPIDTVSQPVRRKNSFVVYAK